MVKWYQRKVQLPQVRVEMVEVANGIISGTNYLGQMGGREGWHMIQPPQNGEGTVGAETVYSLRHRGAALREAAAPQERRQEAGRLREKYCPIRDGSGERNLWEHSPVR